MEPFTITCATCASRIRVRNPELLGQLANCPKCNSMLLIASPDSTPPIPQQPSSRVARIEVERRNGPAVDSTALTQEGLPPELAAVAPVTDSPSEEDDEYHLAPENPEADQAENRLSAPPVQTSAAQARQPSESAWDATPPAHLPSADWTSDSTTKTRQMLLVGFLGFAGVILAILLFVGFLRWHAKDNNTLPDSDRTVVANDPSVDHAEDNSTNPNSPETPETSTDQAVEVAAIDEVTMGTVEPPPEKVTIVESSMVSADRASENSALPASADVNATEVNATGDAEHATPAPAAQELPKQLQAFAPMLQIEIQPQFSDAAEILSEAPVTAEDLGLTSASDSLELPPVDLALQSQATIPALVMRQMPLSQFVSLWSNLSGIPTSVNIDSLTAAGIDRNQNIGLALVKSASIGSLIEQLGKSLGLEALPRENGFLELSVSSTAMEKLLPGAIVLQGLVDQDDEAWLIDSLTKLFPDQAWPWRIEAGKLLRPQSESGAPLDPLTWSAVVRLLEGWRLAAGLPTTLPAYDPMFLTANLVAPSDVTGLDHELQQVQPEARPLSQTIPRICREAEMHAWIDWPALASIGVGPQTTSLVITNARPLRRALANYASEFSFVVAVLDKQTLWFTSNQAYRAAPRLYVVPNDGESADGWQSRLRPLTPSASGGKAVGSVVVIATPNEKFMLVRCCPMLVNFQ